MNDRIRGDRGNDRLIGNDGNDEMEGGQGNDVLIGGLGDDQLLGDSGRDLLRGGLGQDRLTGGRGADTFVLDDRAASSQLADIVTDFSVIQGDKLKLLGGQKFKDLSLEGFDSDGNGSVDSTLIRSRSDQQVLAIVLHTVSSKGVTTLTVTNFI